MLQIPSERFLSQNLNDPISLHRRFDLAISLEVAEHLPTANADGFVQTLTGLADVVLFSGAIPGQGGTHHVNEQWQDWWAKRFLSVGYVAHDLIRPAIWNASQIPVWYRQNVLLYAKQGTLGVAESQGPAWPLNIVHPDQFRSKNMDELGVRGAFGLLSHKLRQFLKVR